jgi:hypothetical protein
MLEMLDNDMLDVESQFFCLPRGTSFVTGVMGTTTTYYVPHHHNIEDLLISFSRYRQFCAPINYPSSLRPLVLTPSRNHDDEMSHSSI